MYYIHKARQIRLRPFFNNIFNRYYTSTPVIKIMQEVNSNIIIN